MNPQPIRFYHRGAVVEVNGPHPTRSVLDWLREDALCTGTKEGCNEGDCGACTVVIGELAQAGDSTAVRGLSLKTVNACIQFLPTLDGKALFTVEDLKGAQGLHPTQQAMVECHGSQCGFCTPGFVMSMWSSYERHSACNTRPSRQELADELSGNLCRCTGYRPILDAGQRMFELPPAALDTTPVVAALQGIQRADGFLYAAFNPQADGPQRIDHFHAPRTLEALASLREQQPQAQLLAGSTDVGLWVNKQFRQLGDIVYVGEVEELRRIEERNGELLIGAGASLEAAWRALVQRWPSLTDVWLRFASPLIRNTGTMGGNIANGSPIGDTAPVLMAL
ncbi:MAG TPA: FAD binding domain-containing protein, partial [Rhizobacter sp.]|nr:FAD binding domain-containing protein [Rhizobacter sp.]